MRGNEDVVQNFMRPYSAKRTANEKTRVKKSSEDVSRRSNEGESSRCTL